MKKYIYYILVGMVIGTLMAGGMAMRAFGAEESSGGIADWWEDQVAKGDFDWQDVFGAVGLSQNKFGKNIYNLVYDKIVIRAESDAMEVFARTHGITEDEAKGIMNGSTAVIVNNAHLKGSNKKYGDLTFDEANQIIGNLRESFEQTKEIIDIEKDLETGVVPTEIFANGDVSDSGFDLVFDLTVIEQILFENDTEVSVGGEYDDGYDSAFDGDDDDESDQPVLFTEGTAGESTPVIGSDGEGGSIAKIKIGDSEIKAEVLDEDICEDENEYEKALKEYSGDDDDDSGAGGGGDDDDSSGDDDDDSDSGGGDDLTPPPADRWGSVWCPGFNIGNQPDQNPATQSIGQIEPSDENEGSTNFTIMLPICLSIEMLEESYASQVVSGDSCVQCEVEQINSLMDETLLHSLVPNKVTGNIMESAKCKQTFSTSGLIDLKVITISSPVLTPPNDDLIADHNVFEEWNKLAERQGWRSLQVADDYIDEFTIRNVPDWADNFDVLVDISSEQNRVAADAILDIENIQTSEIGSNSDIYSRALLPEMKQMTTYFKRMQKLYADSAAVCNDIASNKPTIY